MPEESLAKQRVDQRQTIRRKISREIMNIVETLWLEWEYTWGSFHGAQLQGGRYSVH